LNKRKLTKEVKRRKNERKAAFMNIFINGRRTRVRRPQLIEGMSVDEFIARNADPLWLHLNEMWELNPLDVDAETTEDFPKFLRSQKSKLSASDQPIVNESSKSQRKESHGQGIEEVPF
jgi:hypothetical protein